MHRLLTKGHQDQPVPSHHVYGSTPPEQEGLGRVGAPRTGCETNTTPNHRLHLTPGSAVGVWQQRRCTAPRCR